MEKEIMRQAVFSYKQKGLNPVLLKYLEKYPAFKGWSEKLMDWPELDYWLRKHNFGVAHRLDDYTVIDADGPKGLRFMEGHRIESPMEVLTSKGKHVYFRINEEVKKTIRLVEEIDVLTGKTSLANLPPTYIGDSGWTYQLEKGKQILSADELPEVPRVILDLQRQVKQTVEPIFLERKGDITDLAKYISKIPSVQGANGSKGLMRTCYVLAERLPFTEALQLLTEWNCNAMPPWSDGELERALSRAFHKKNQHR